MLSVAIVDDDIQICSILEEYIRQKFYFLKLKICDFADGSELINSVNEGAKYEIVFLDIYMESVGGYEAGRFLRSVATHEDCYIIFISSVRDNLVPLFSLHPFDFITKPICYERFSDIMDKLYSDIENKSLVIIVKYKGKDVLVNISQILYITTRSDRKIEIKLKDSTSAFYAIKLSDFYKNYLQGYENFIQVHKSFVVNFRYVRVFSNTDIQLYHCNDLIPISRAFRNDVMQKYYNSALVQSSLSLQGGTNDI